MTIMADGANGEPPSLSRSEVRTIFKMAEDEQWVRDFLLRADPYEEAKLLSEPVQSMYTLSGEHVLTVNKTVTGLDEPRVLSRWLLMPAFNCGTRAAGLFIQNKSPAVCDVGSTMHFVRFVRDDETGEVLYITEIPESGSIEVMHTALQGPTKRRAAYLRFDATRFRRVFSERGDVTALIDALQTSCLITEMCVCRKCGASAGTKCTCTLSLQRAAHPLDFRFYRHNSDHMFGIFQGRMTLSTYAAGQERSCQTYRVQNATECSSSSFTQALLRGAVANRIRLLQANPRNLVVPNTTQSMIVPPGTGGISPRWNNVVPPAVAEPMSSLDASEFGNVLDQIAVTGSGGLDLEDVHEVDLTASSPAHMLGMGLPASAGTAPQVRIMAAPLLPKLVVPAQPVAPAPLTPNSMSTAGSTSDPSSPTSLPLPVTLDKNMARKIRKREAAERSNNRRHLKRVELKRQLEEAKTKIASLQNRKKQLEEEHLRLQTRLDAARFDRDIPNDESFFPPPPGASLISLSELLQSA